MGPAGPSPPNPSRNGFGVGTADGRAEQPAPPSGQRSTTEGVVPPRVPIRTASRPSARQPSTPHPPCFRLQHPSVSADERSVLMPEPGTAPASSDCPAVGSQTLFRTIEISDPADTRCWAAAVRDESGRRRGGPLDLRATPADGWPVRAGRLRRRSEGLLRRGQDGMRGAGRRHGPAGSPGWLRLGRS